MGEVPVSELNGLVISNWTSRWHHLHTWMLSQEQYEDILWFFSVFVSGFRFEELVALYFFFMDLVTKLYYLKLPPPLGQLSDE